MAFRICGRKGFLVTFPNGWTVSVQFGRGNYGSNYSFDGDCQDEVPAAETAEVAAWPASGDWLRFDNGDEVDGHYSAEKVLALMNRVAAFAPVEPEPATQAVAA